MGRSRRSGRLRHVRHVEPVPRLPRRRQHRTAVRHDQSRTRMATTSSTCRPSRRGGRRRWDWAAATRSSSRSSPARRRASTPTCPAWCRTPASAVTASPASASSTSTRRRSPANAPDFTREMVNAVPWPADNPSAAHANYGMLARDGITCTTCHRMVLNTDAAEGLPRAAECLHRRAPGAAQSGGIAIRQDFHRQLHGRRS